MLLSTRILTDALTGLQNVHHELSASKVCDKVSGQEESLVEEGVSAAMLISPPQVDDLERPDPGDHLGVWSQDQDR